MPNNYVIAYSYLVDNGRPQSVWFKEYELYIDGAFVSINYDNPAPNLLVKEVIKYV